MRNERNGATAGTQGEGSGRDSLGALLRLERALESAGAMDSWLARDVAALRLELGKRTGDTGQLISANLRMFAGLVEAELCDGESKPDLRGVEVATSDVVKRYRLESVITPENERSVSAHVRKKLSGEMDRY